jgi:hypothetical protein
MARKLTAADLCEVTGYSRAELRSVLNALPYYSTQKSYPRKARQFTRQDLIVICLVQVLETQYGMRKDAIAEVFDVLRSTLSGPKDQNRQARLVISLSPPTVRYEEAPAVVSAGTCVPLEPVFDRVDRHLGSFLGLVPEQRDLALSPALIAGRTGPK